MKGVVYQEWVAEPKIRTYNVLDLIRLLRYVFIYPVYAKSPRHVLNDQQKCIAHHYEIIGLFTHQGEQDIPELVPDCGHLVSEMRGRW